MSEKNQKNNSKKNMPQNITRNATRQTSKPASETASKQTSKPASETASKQTSTPTSKSSKNVSTNKTKNTGKNHNNKGRKKVVILDILMVICIIAFVGCAIYLIKYFYEAKKSEDKFDDLKELIIEDDDTDDNSSEVTIGSNSASKQVNSFVEIDGKYILKKFKNLYEKNTDFVGWLTINDTPIDYPVMQSMDDEQYYIYRDFDKQYSGNGSLFIDTSSDVAKPSDSILIYGHNMQSGLMFHCLTKYDDETYYKEHNIITFDTIYGKGQYEIIAAFRDKIYDEDYAGIKYYEFFDASSEQEFNDFITYCKSKTPYEINETATYGDKLICLSTCAYHTTNGRFVVLAKKIN